MNSVNYAGQIYSVGPDPKPPAISMWAWLRDDSGWVRILIPPHFIAGFKTLLSGDRVSVQGTVNMQIDVGNRVIDAYVNAVLIEALAPASRAKVANKAWSLPNNRVLAAMDEGPAIYERLSKAQTDIWAAQREARDLEGRLNSQKRDANEAILQLMTGGGDAKSQA